MSFYIIICIFFAGLSFYELFCRKDARILKTACIFSCVCLIIMSSIRGSCGGDYGTYKEVFERMTDTSGLFSEQNFFYEPLYSILQWVCKAVAGSFQFFLLVISFLVIGLEHRYAREFSMETSGMNAKTENSQLNRSRKADGKYYFTLFFILWALYNANIFAIRSSIALCFCLYSVKYIEKKELIKFIFCMLIAAGFHFSVLIFIAAYWIYHVHCRLSVKLAACTAVTALLTATVRPAAQAAASVIKGSIRAKINGYLYADGLMFATGITKSVFLIYGKAVLNIGVLITAGIFLWKYHKNDKKFEGCLNLYLTGCCLYLSTLTIGYAVARISIYYNIFQIPVLMYLFSSTRTYGRNRKIFWFIAAGYLMLRLAVNYSTPFQVFWNTG